MQGQELEAQQVFPGLDVGWDRSSPCLSVCNQLIGCPVERAGVEETFTRDLEPDVAGSIK